jgi:endoglucanase
MPLISRNLPAFYSGSPVNGDTNSLINNNDYTEKNGYQFGLTSPTQYPAYVAYNLSSVPAVQQGKLAKIYTTWNNGANYYYDPPLFNFGDIGTPYNYTIDANCQSLSTNTYPTSGWVTLTTVTANTLRSRSHILNMVDSTAGNPCNGNYNWIRFNATQGSQVGGWLNFQLKWDIWDATLSTDDTWMFYGDSIIANDSMDKSQSWGDTFANQIHAWNSNYYPSMEMGGYGGKWASDYADWTVNKAVPPARGTTTSGSTPWLPKVTSHFVVLALGTNDCNAGGAGNFNNDMSALVDHVLAADPTRVVVLPTLQASPQLRSGTNTVNINGTPTQVTGGGGGPACNNIIANVISAKKAQYGASHVIAGPDLWTATIVPNSDWGDNLHPAGNANGMGLYRTAWVQWAENNVYGGVSNAIAPVNTAVPAITGLSTVGAVITSNTGSWNNNPTNFAYLWQRCDSTGSNCSNISGATNSTYTLQSADVGFTIKVTVTASNGGGSASATSAKTQTISNPVINTMNGISVSGNRYVTGSGKTIQLHGVLHNGPEYACAQGFGLDDGPGKTGWVSTDQVMQTMTSWNINTMIVMLDEDCWLGINGISASLSGQNYINYIQSLVTSAEKYGIYPTLAYAVGEPGTDHVNFNNTPGGQPMLANSDHTPLFWEEVANTFKSDPNVILRLEEEPRTGVAPNSDTDTGLSSWQCWSQGDVQYMPSGVNTPPTAPTSASSNKHCNLIDDAGHTYNGLGMQSMINIIRGTGANNVIQVPGIAYADALSCSPTTLPTTCGFLDTNAAHMTGCAPGQVPCTVEVHDTLSNSQLGADIDNYPDIGQICGTVGNSTATLACFNTEYGPVAAAMPLDSGETGVFGSTIGGGFPLEQAFINWLDSNNGNYYGAAWTVASSYNMISSYNGTPISPWGTWFQAHLIGLASAPPGPKIGDVNGDNSVNITDLSLLLSSYGQSTTQCTTNSAYKCDLSSPADGVVNIFDLSILLSHYGS